MKKEIQEANVSVSGKTMYKNKAVKNGISIKPTKLKEIVLKRKEFKKALKIFKEEAKEINKRAVTRKEKYQR